METTRGAPTREDQVLTALFNEIRNKYITETEETRNISSMDSDTESDTDFEREAHNRPIGNQNNIKSEIKAEIKQIIDARKAILDKLPHLSASFDKIMNLLSARHDYTVDEIYEILTSANDDQDVEPMSCTGTNIEDVD